MRYIEPQIIVKKRFSNEEKPLFDVAVFIFRDKKSSDFIKEVLKCKEYKKELAQEVIEMDKSLDS